MEINKLYHFLFNFFVGLNITATILLFFRSDKKMIVTDIKVFLKINNFFICLGVFLMILSILPFTIPYSLENIYKKLNNK